MKIAVAAAILSAFGLQLVQADSYVELFYHTNYQTPSDGFQNITVTPSQSAKPGHCFSTGKDLTGTLNDRIHSAIIVGNVHCVFWANENCSGDHTNMLFGLVPDFNHVCSGGWQSRISSFKCCDGLDNSWCGGSAADCT